jgi:hypothetical protein
MLSSALITLAEKIKAKAKINEQKIICNLFIVF